MRNETRLHSMPPVSGRGRILLIDNDANDLRLYSVVLEQHGYTVWSVSSYHEDESSVWRLDPDLILVSHGSVAFEGQTVVRCAVERDRRIPVVVMTRCIDMSCYLEAMQLGAVDYLEKPREPSQILEMVRRHLRPSIANVGAGVGRHAGEASPEDVVSELRTSARL